MAGCCNPILVNDRAAAPVRAGEAEKGRPSDGHLPRPSTERRILAADYSLLRPLDHDRFPAL